MIPPMSDMNEGATTAQRAPEGQALAGLGAYRFERELGAGGMGAVFLARHRVRPGVFAVKVLKPSLATSHGLRQRFEREARLGIDLHHPGIVDVVDFVVDGNRQALVMEYVQGETLQALLQRLGRPLSWDEAEPVFRRLLGALAYAHGRGVIHRDIKPGNVMMAVEGGVKIMDFGIAHLEGVSGDSTHLVLGTVKYTAPELFDGSAPTGRSDLYSLGMTLYQMVAGRLPFPAGTPVGQLVAMKQAGLEPPSDLVPGLPPIVDRAVQLMTSPDPAARPDSCDRILTLLDAAMTLVGAATPVLLAPRPELASVVEPGDALPPADEPTGNLRRLSALAPSLAMMALLAVVVMLVLTGRGKNEELRRPDPELARAAHQVEVAPDSEAPGVEATAIDDERTLPDPFRSPEADATSPSGARATRSRDPAPGSLLGVQPKRGSLEVRAIPGAWVVIAGQRVGQASPRGVTLDLAPGEYKVRLICDDRDLCGAYDRTSVVERATVSAGGYASVYVDFAALEHGQR